LAAVPPSPGGAGPEPVLQRRTERAEPP